MRNWLRKQLDRLRCPWKDRLVTAYNAVAQCACDAWEEWFCRPAPPRFCCDCRHRRLLPDDATGKVASFCGMTYTVYEYDYVTGNAITWEADLCEDVNIDGSCLHYRHDGNYYGGSGL